MSDIWDRLPLSELVSEIIDNRGKTVPISEAGIPLIATNCISNEGLYPKYEKVRYVSESTYKTWFRGHPKPYDIIFVNKGTPGLVSLVPDPIDFCIAQDMVALRPNEDLIDGKFLFAALRSPSLQTQIANLHVGTLIPHVKKGDFNKIFIPLLPRKTQEFIGQIYFNISSKIEANRQQNITLEEIARAIFKSWFVDFDPVHAKARGEMPYGMDAETADLFPDSFEESELGMIPHGWRVGTVGDLCINILSGGTPNTGKKEYWNGHIPWLSSGETREPFIISTERTISDLGVKESSTRFVPSWSVVIAGAGQGQTRGQSSLLMIDSYINQSTLALIPNLNKSNALYIFFNLSNRYEELRTISDSHSSRGSLTKILINSLGILQPIPECLFAFELIVKPMIEKISNNLMQIRTLIEIRDSLLSKLISGEIQLEGLYELV